MEASDDSFGPQLSGSFDFTLLFEQTILSIAPSCVFILASAARVSALRRKPLSVGHGELLWFKLGTVGALACVQAALVALWSVHAAPPATRASIPAAALSVAASLAVAAQSYAEHTRSIRPSFLLAGYLLLSAVLDAAQVRSLWIRDGGRLLRPVAALSTAALALKAALLVLEESDKSALLLHRGPRYVAVEATSGLFSRSLFWWLNSLLYQGCRSVMTLQDLSSIDDRFNSEQVLNHTKRFWDRGDKSKKHILLRAIFSSFRRQFLIGVLPRLCFTGFTFAQPFLVNRVIDFVGYDSNQSTKDVAGGLIGATVLVYVGIGISRAVYHHLTYQLLTLYRGALVSLIFYETLEVDTSELAESASVTLMSTDIDYICMAFQDIHELWANPIELGLAIFLLWRQIGAPCFVVAVPTILCTIATRLIAGGMGPAKVEWSKGVQKRVHITSSLLAQIKSIKMMGLSEYMRDTIQGLRTTEVEFSKKYRVLISWLNLLVHLASSFTPVAVIAGVVFWTLGGTTPLTIVQAFTALSVVYLVEKPLVQIISSYPTFMAAVASFDRIEAYLLLKKQEDSREVDETGLSSPRAHTQLLQGTSQPAASGTDAVEIELDDTTALPSKSTDANYSILDISSGYFSLKDKSVLSDINLALPKGSLSIVLGRVGSGKSSLLRAMLGELHQSKGTTQIRAKGVSYCHQTPWLRNISIRDNIVGKTDFDERWYNTVVDACALGPDLDSFPNGDSSLVGSGGVALSGGQKQRVALARAVYARKELVLLDDTFAGLDNATAASVFHKVLGRSGLLRQAGATVVLASSSVTFIHSADFVTVLHEGSISHNQAKPGSLHHSIVGALENVVGAGAERAADGGGKAFAANGNVEASVEDGRDSDTKRVTGDMSLYLMYFKSVGWFMSLVFLISSIVWISTGSFFTVWLRLWTEAGSQNGTGWHFAVYASLAVIYSVVGGFTIWFYLVVMVPKSSQHLHYLLLEAVLNAPLYFFSTTDSGVTLNRFSQDMTLVDQALPMAFLTTTLDIWSVIGQTALICAGGTYVAAVIPFSMLGCYVLQKFYLRTSRQMRFLDLEAKSPLYTHFTETLAGLATIRAFGWREAFAAENHARLDASQTPFYLLYCIQRWLNLVLDLFVAGLALVLVAMAVELGGATTKGAIALAMVSLISFNHTLAHFINSWTTLETSLGAIARLKSFLRDTPKEDLPAESQQPPLAWPSNGQIELTNVTAAYRSDSEPVLRNISVKFQPGEKVAVCGRTGSGKSSLVLTIVHLLELQTGTVLIDGVDAATLPRQTLRSRITTLPQDPVKIEGTVRENLDPLKRHAGRDGDLTAALEKTRIWPAVNAHGGLDADFEEVGLSHGQQQLFCLARAVLEKESTKIILLDEATSSVDRNTEDEVRRVLREEFGACTVVEVAHKLEAVVGYANTVLVLDKGELVECGSPSTLLATDGSSFKGLWEKRFG